MYPFYQWWPLKKGSFSLFFQGRPQKHNQNTVRFPPLGKSKGMRAQNLPTGMKGDNFPALLRGPEKNVRVVKRPDTVCQCDEA
jgi:hypothetical protein